MIVLGIESSCDETAAAVVDDKEGILSSIVASQIDVHKDYGGVVPELASREHVDNIALVVEASLAQCSQRGRPIALSDLDAIAVTRGPGLMGALLVGLTYAKGLAYALDIPFLGVNHLEGHIASVFLEHPQAELPALSLVVSGGHTNLYLLEADGNCRLLARTLDDAAGEALDKLSKLLGLGYPGGPVIERLARHGDPGKMSFTLPKISRGGIAFSFSGLKTAALRQVRRRALKPLEPSDAERAETIPSEILDLLAGYQKAVVDQLLDRLDKALRKHLVKSIHLSGGVSCNSELRLRTQEMFAERGLPVYFPRSSLTTDNAAMIAAAALGRLKAGESDPWETDAEPNLKVSRQLRLRTS